jgi:transcription-repair coupling factor (superfamily II helicase)
MFEKLLNSESLKAAAGRLAGGKTVRLAGLWGSAPALTAAALGRIKGAPVLFVARHLDDADDVADDVEVFTGTPACLFPAWEVDIGTEHVNDEIAGERLNVCNMLASPPAGKAPPLVVAPVMALLQPVPTREVLSASSLQVRCGTELTLDDLTAWLVDAGFQRTEQVDQQGEFASRGGIVDVLPMGFARAVRIELFGDEVASIRLFDLDTQRSVDQVSAVEITGISAGHLTDPSQTTTLLDYLPAGTIVCLHEPGDLASLAEELHRRLEEEEGGPAETRRSVEPGALFGEMERFAVAEMYTFAGRRGRGVIDLGVRSLERLVVNTYEALKELSDLAQAAEVWVYCENPAERQRFAELLARQQPDLAGRVKLGIGHVAGGFYWPDERLVVVGHHELFHRYAKARRIRRIRAGRPIESLLDLSEGDIVVHLAHGIAKFEGLRTLQKDGKSEEFLSLRFAGNAVLHVPASRIDLVQKYIGSGRKRPALSALGGTGWQRQKDRAAEAVKDMAVEMLRIQAMRESTPGVSYPGATELQRRFADEFIYTETPDQLAAMQQIDADMSAGRPMDRLLCGDVGYGKTELAIRAAFKAAEGGRQTAVLVPTTVLADQHYRTFSERFADYPVRVDVLSRFRTNAEQEDVTKRLVLGQIDVLIGTHRLLSKDVRFADLGLVVIDEEQRFGVEHKERLKTMRATVEVLTMTATPIPRTLHMALLGLRDISSLTTAPLDRRAIHTEVCHYNDELVRKAILRELNRAGQVFFVHNRVMDIEALADRVRSLVPDARVAVGHGQMPEGRLEKTMLAFVHRDVDVLVCTTIIESGLDIPTANTMIVHNADRFGLAELHQLRGRVGRYKHRAYCYLMLPETRTVSAVAARRLKAIEEFSDLGAGFQIAMRDLEIRGAGNILGRQQSGHIAAVGYELYCRLLETAVGELKGEAPDRRRDVHVELGVDIYIPRWYVPADRQRMEVYRRIVKCRRADELAQLAADLADAYGAVPPLVQTLLDVAEIRIHAGGLGIDSIIRMDPDIVFTVSNMAAARKVFEGGQGSARMPDQRTIHWRPPPAYLEMPTLVTVLLRRLRQAAGQL